MLAKKETAARKEAMALRKEIRMLNKKVTTGLRARTRQIAKAATSPTAKRRARKAKKAIKEGLSAFQKFANKHGGL